MLETLEIMDSIYGPPKEWVAMELVAKFPITKNNPKLDPGGFCEFYIHGKVESRFLDMFGKKHAVESVEWLKRNGYKLYPMRPDSEERDYRSILARSEREAVELYEWGMMNP